MTKLMKLLILVAIISLVPINVLAANDIPAEKAWVIEMNTSILNSSENLENVIVTDRNGKEIETIVRVSNENSKLLEVIPLDILQSKQYIVAVKAGFKSSNGLVTSKPYEKTFNVTLPMTTIDLKGTWKTNYTHNQELYNITVTYNNGIADLNVVTSTLSVSGPEQYQLSNGSMQMEITDFNVQLSGEIKVFNNNKFLVISPTGKEAVFIK